MPRRYKGGGSPGKQRPPDLATRRTAGEGAATRRSVGLAQLRETGSTVAKSPAAMPVRRAHGTAVPYSVTPLPLIATAGTFSCRGKASMVETG